MNFLDRFQGKIQLMTKDGIQSGPNDMPVFRKNQTQIFTSKEFVINKSQDAQAPQIQKSSNNTVVKGMLNSFSSKAPQLLEQLKFQQSTFQSISQQQSSSKQLREMITKQEQHQQNSALQSKNSTRTKFNYTDYTGRERHNPNEGVGGGGLASQFNNFNDQFRSLPGHHFKQPSHTEGQGFNYIQNSANNTNTYNSNTYKAQLLMSNPYMPISNLNNNNNNNNTNNFNKQSRLPYNNTNANKNELTSSNKQMTNRQMLDQQRKNTNSAATQYMKQSETNDPFLKQNFYMARASSSNSGQFEKSALIQNQKLQNINIQKSALNILENKQYNINSDYRNNHMDQGNLDGGKQYVQNELNDYQQLQEYNRIQEQQMMKENERYNYNNSKGNDDPLQRNAQHEPQKNKTFNPYTLEQFKLIKKQPGFRMGGLGPNIDTEEWNTKKKKVQKMQDFSENVKILNQQKIANQQGQGVNRQFQIQQYGEMTYGLEGALRKQNANIQAMKHPSSRERALEFAKVIPKPKLKQQQLQIPPSLEEVVNQNNQDMNADGVVKNFDFNLEDIYASNINMQQEQDNINEMERFEMEHIAYLDKIEKRQLQI